MSHIQKIFKKDLIFCETHAIIIFVLKYGEKFPLIMKNRIWACGAVGSVLEWHSRGRGFDPLQVHQMKTPLISEPLRLDGNGVFVINPVVIQSCGLFVCSFKLNRKTEKV